MKIHIEKIMFRDGNTNGRAWRKCAIVSDKKWYTCFDQQLYKDWKEGDTIEQEVIEKPYTDKEGRKVMSYEIVSPKKAQTFKQDEIERNKIDVILQNTIKILSLLEGSKLSYPVKVSVKEQIDSGDIGDPSDNDVPF